MKNALASIALLFIASTLIAQSRGKSGDVTLSSVNDRRSSGSFARLMLSLEVKGVRSGDFAASRVFIQSAQDESGNSLLLPQEGEPQLQNNTSMIYGGKESLARPASIDLELKSPPRSSSSVREVRGEIELSMPSRDPNSTAAIPRITSMAGKALSHKALKANGVEIVVVSKAQLDAEKKQAVDQKRKELAAEGMSGDDLDSSVSSFAENYFAPDEGDMVLRVKDPNKRVQQLSYVNGAGETKMTTSHDEKGMTILSTFGDKPEANWSLRVSLQTPKNTVRFPFVLSNIPLP